LRYSVGVSGTPATEYRMVVNMDFFGPPTTPVVLKPTRSIVTSEPDTTSLAICWVQFSSD
jgi:hypothetical protein